MDDPQLTVRPKKKGMQNPARVIVAGSKQYFPSAKIFNNAHKERVIYATTASLSISSKKKITGNWRGSFLVKRKKEQVDLPLN